MSNERPAAAVLVLSLLSIVKNTSPCAVHCTKFNDFLCVDESRVTPEFLSRTSSLAHLLFSFCHFDTEERNTYRVVQDDSGFKINNYRSTIAVTLAECAEDQLDMEQIVGNVHQKWYNPECSIDDHLILIVHNETLIVETSSTRKGKSDLQLEQSYSIDLLNEITEISLLKMEEANRITTDSTNKELTHKSTQDIKSHWPTWALVVVVVCIVLSLVAFFLGNYITKKATPIRNKGQTTNAVKGRERKWGAGFSGGLWAAA